MIYYFIQVILFQLISLGVYELLLKKETFFNLNRGYLVITATLSVILPFINVTSFKNVISSRAVMQLPEIVIGSATDEAINNLPFTFNPSTAPSYSVIELIYYMGVFIAISVLLYKLIRLVRLFKTGAKIEDGKLVVIRLPNSSSAFSFFNYVFLGEQIDQGNQTVITAHEIVHATQKHTLDLLFFEFLRVAFWFSPLVYVYQNKIMALHEFIADEHVAKHHDKKDYYHNLLSQVFQTQNMSFINQFYKQSLIKKRIIMLSKTKSKKINLLKYALLFPMIFGMLVCTSCLQNAKALSNPEHIEGNMPIIEMVKAIRTQLLIQGETNASEDNALQLLLGVIREDALNEDFVQKVQTFMSSNNKTELEEKIAAVFEQIQVQGTLSNADERALKNLLVLIADNGLNDPFFADILDEVAVPFGIIDKVPVFPGCEDLDAKAQKKCMVEHVTSHISSTFNTKLASELGLKGKQRINVMFKIDNTGEIVDVRARCPHDQLRDEAIRVIKTLPKMNPGEHQGKKVNVPYSLPIIFHVD